MTEPMTKVELCCGACAELHGFSPIDAQRIVLALHGMLMTASLEEAEEEVTEICLNDLITAAADPEAYADYVVSSLDAAYAKAGRDFDAEHERETEQGR